MAAVPNSPASRPRKRNSAATKPSFVTRNGRRYHNNESIPYCLPCDVRELSRQTLWHELNRELWGGYSSIDFTVEKIPDRVLEVGCGSGLWSACMADEFAKMGRPDVHFVGIDLVDIHMDMQGVDFKFVKHDFVGHSLPFADGTFDFVFSRDVMMCYPAKNMYQDIVGEMLRITKPGGLIEIQCNDYIIRTLQRSSVPYHPGSSAYEITSTTQFSTQSENPLIMQWNDRIHKALVKRELPPVPCTLVGASFVAEEGVTAVISKRLALPLDAIWWESPSAAADSASTSESSSSLSSKRRSTSGSSVESALSSSSRQYRARGASAPASSYKHQHHHHRHGGGGGTGSNKGSSASGESSNNGYPTPLTDEERAVRQLAKLIFVQLIEALEPVLREANDIDLDEWDSWYRELMWSWFENHGLRGGECIEFGAWAGRKKP